MSKQSEAKEKQCYVPKVIPMTCSNCKHFKRKITEREGVFGGRYIDESDKRCGIGGFAVKKLGSCNLHEFVG